MKRSIRLAAVAMGLCGVLSVRGATCTWNGAGANNNASNPTNWVGVVAPAPGDDIVLDATSSKNVSWDSAAPGSVGSWTQVGYVGTVTVNTVYGNTGFTNLAIAVDCVISNGMWTHQVNGSTEQYRLRVTIASNLIVGASGRIDVSYQGYDGSFGPAGSLAVDNFRGPSHGGRGGKLDNTVLPALTYGSINSPTNLGAGGWANSESLGPNNGGGAAWLTVGGKTILDGQLLANGGPRDGNCTGAGGSLYLVTGEFAGAGALRANGGGAIANIRSGGGGRIAILLTKPGDFSDFTGATTAYGGNTVGGAAGTVYFETSTDSPGRGVLLVDNGNHPNAPDTATDLNDTLAVTGDFSRIVVTNGGNIGVSANDVLMLTNTLVSGTGTNRAEGFSLFGGTLVVPDPFAFTNYYIRTYTNGNPRVLSPSLLTVGTNATLIVDAAAAFSNITVAAGGVITHDYNGTVEQFHTILTVASNLNVQTGGRIDVTQKGFDAPFGPGLSVNNNWGASYGGEGAKNAGLAGAPVYGSIYAPTNVGSGGADERAGGSRGGGAAILTVGDTLTVDGQILANGGPRDGNCSAAGGTISITAGHLTGGGGFQANGGSATIRGGGGGRVAIVRTQPGDVLSEFAGTIAAAGQGSGAGGAGTIYLRTSGQAVADGTLIVDGSATASSAGALIATNIADRAFGDVLLRNGGRLALQPNIALTVSGVWSNSAVFSPTNGSAVTFAGGGASTSAVYGSTAFRVLQCTTPGKTLRFAAASSNTVLEGFTLTGAAGSNIVLRSLTDGTQWKLNVDNAAVQTVGRVDVRDSDARPGTAVTALNAIDSGNNSNWIFSALGQTDVWTGVSSTAWGNSGNWSLGRAPIPDDDKATIPAGCPNFPVLDAPRVVNKLELAAGASLTLNGFDFTARGDTVLAGALIASGAERVNLLGSSVDFAGASVTPAASTVLFGGSTAQSVNLAGLTLWNVWVTNTAGIVTLNGGFTAKELRCDGSGSAQSVAFTASSTVNVRELVLLGSTSATNLTLRSTSPGTRWHLNVTTYNTVRGVDVQDSDASGGLIIEPMNSRDSGNNLNWDFSAVWATWLGTSSASFATAANWQPAVVPDASTRVLVESANALVLSSPASVRELLVGGGAGATWFTDNAALTVGEDMVVRTGATFVLNQPVTVSNNVKVLSGSVLTHQLNAAADTYRLTLTGLSNMTVEAGARLDVTQKGYDAYHGPGTANDNIWGSSYGGQGTKNAGTAGAPTYGSVLNPTNSGSGGPGETGAGSKGGGTVVLDVRGTLALDGQILANGGDRDGNCTPAGGSINLACGRFTGGGTVQAKGGVGSVARGGGGGRLSLRLSDPSAAFADYTGTWSVTGQGTYGGGAGTFYLQAPGEADGRGRVIVDNKGLSGGLTVLPAQTLGVSNELRYATLILTNSGTRVQLSAEMGVADIFIYPGAVLDLTNVNLQVYTRQHNFGGGSTVSAGGQIIWHTPAGSIFLVR